MKEIILSKGLVTLVDDCDYDKLSAKKWCASLMPTTGQYIATHTAYDKKTKKRQQLCMHRVITGCPSDLVVDHINHNTLDNRRHNLRVCTKQQNTWNQRVNRNNKSGVKGVCYVKDVGKFIARIGYNGKQRTIGYFSTAKEAGLAYNATAVELFGDFAFLNEIRV